MRPLPFLLLPTIALVAQAPASVSYSQKFNTELPIVNQMLKDLKTQEALERVQSSIPAQRPTFNASSPQAIGTSLDNAQGLASFYRLWANVTLETGQWEKVQEIQEKRAQFARDVLADLDKAQAPIAAQWAKVSQEATTAIQKGEARKAEVEPQLAAFKTEYEELKSGKRKASKKEIDEFNVRATQMQQVENEVADINAAIPVHKQNLANAPKVTKLLNDNRKEITDMVKAADEAVAKAKLNIQNQNDEITKFNTEQVMKKVKVVGKKNWVDAVMRNHDNITKLGEAQAQAAFLSRLLVLDPGNAEVSKALANLKAGKEAFEKEVKKGGKKASPKK